MLKYKTLPQNIECVFIQNILKLFAHVVDQHEKEGKLEEVLPLCDAIIQKLQETGKSAELEVQERASNTLAMVDVIKELILNSTLPVESCPKNFNVRFQKNRPMKPTLPLPPNFSRISQATSTLWRRKRSEKCPFPRDSTLTRG